MTAISSVSASHKICLPGQVPPSNARGNGESHGSRNSFQSDLATIDEHNLRQVRVLVSASTSPKVFLKPSSEAVSTPTERKSNGTKTSLNYKLEFNKLTEVIDVYDLDDPEDEDNVKIDRRIQELMKGLSDRINSSTAAEKEMAKGEIERRDFLHRAITNGCSLLIIKNLMDFFEININSEGGSYQTIPLFHALNFLNENQNTLGLKRIELLTDVCKFFIKEGSNETDSKYGNQDLSPSGNVIYRSYKQLREVLSPRFQDVIKTCDRAFFQVACPCVIL